MNTISHVEHPMPPQPSTQDDLWHCFDGQRNDERILKSKACMLSGIFCDTYLGFYSLLIEEWGQAILLERSVVADEVLVVLLHAIDRLAFHYLGPIKRNWFYDVLVFQCVEKLGSLCQSDEDRQFYQNAVVTLHNQRQATYGTRELFSKKNEKGGWNVGDTVGYAFGELISCCAPSIGITFEVFLTRALAALQFSQLMVGYPGPPTKP